MAEPNPFKRERHLLGAITRRGELDQVLGLVVVVAGAKLIFT